MLRRPSFLSLFFTALAILFAVAVVYRLGSPETDAPAPGPQAQRETPPPSPPPPPRGAVSAVPENEPLRSAERRRAAQYRELLREIPPAGSAAPPHAPPESDRPSLASRIVAPLVSAFGGGEERSAPDSRPRPDPRGAPLQAEASPPATAQGRTGPPSARTAEDSPANPDSDTTAPRLLGIEFQPATVQDGDSTILTITASDDLSGIKTVAGNIASPGGALQGFSLEREGESRFVGRVTVPKNAAEGLWHVNFVSLTDGASNTAILTWRQNTIPRTASFLVSSSKPDTTPPSVRAIWLDRPTVRGGERAGMSVEMEEDQSGVQLVTGVFISPSRFARIPVGCRQQSPQSPVWQCDVAPPAKSDCGEWQLEQLQVQDKANNQSVLRSDNPLVARVRLAVTADTCDSVPPVAQSAAVEAGTVAAPGFARIIVSASDDSSGISTVNGHFAFTGPIASGGQPPRLYFSCRASGDGQTWLGVVTVPEKAARGPWRLGSLQLVDAAGNLKVYVDPEPVLNGVGFRVE